MISTLKKCIGMVPRELRTGWLGLPFLGLLAGALEGGQAGAIYLLIRLMGEPRAIFEFTKWPALRRVFEGATDIGIILRFAALLAVYHVVKNLIVIGSHYRRQNILAGTNAALSSALFRGYLLVPLPFHFRRHSAELVRNTTHAVAAAVAVLEAFDGLIRRGFTVVSLTVVLIATSPTAALGSGVALALLVTGLLRLTRAMAERGGSAQHELGQSLQQTIQNALGGIREIKALGREPYFYRTFSDVQRQILELGHLNVTLSVIPQVMFETAFVLAALVAAVLLATQPSASTTALPVMGLLGYAGFRMIVMANPIITTINQIRAARAPVDALHEDFLLIRRETASLDMAGESPVTLRSEMVLEGVSYSYPAASRPALTDASMRLKVGEAIGVVGPTGAGKSTLVDLIVGLLIPATGRVLVDGVDVTRNPMRWRQKIGYVPQSIFLLDDTLRRNVAMGIPDDEIEEQAVVRAIQMAQLDRLVDAWPEGLSTVLGERGIRLSGGERQRVGIARALYHDPDLLVFDEATAALDGVTEAEVTRSIHALRGRKSMLVIAHRLSTVRACDRLLYLEDGRIVAQASYDDLLASNDRFRLMAAASGAQPHVVS
ncbi:MAG: ABC transporter ATP-binding protein [Gemmatimonadaceae bacterium]|jgi:ATP-binding cassette subfamily C protein